MALTMADFDVMQAALAQNGGQPNRMIVKFYPGDVIDEKRTYGWVDQKFDPNTGLPGPVIRHAGEGGDYYKPHPWIEIRAPGDKDEIRQRPMRESDKRLYPREWALFQQGMADPAEGTPLEIVPFLSKGQVNGFRADGMSTVEHVADISDVNGQKYMDFQRVRQKCRDYLAMQAKAGPAVEMRRELEQRDARIAALEEQIRIVTEDRSKKK